MTERLLQYIWQFQYFNRDGLLTQTGEAIQVLHPGIPNYNQGPDFSAARIRMDNLLLAGNVELHVKSSGWTKHGHQLDSNYHHILLHVVWEDDAPGNQEAPVLVLQHRVPRLLLRQYSEWMAQPAVVPCGRAAAGIHELVWASWKERLLAERLQRKSDYVLQVLAANNYHWEEAFWQLLARNFGIKVNADAFEAVARSLPLVLLSKHRHQLLQLEALLLGQANLLEGAFGDDYARKLQHEYHFLQHKCSLEPIQLPVHHLRMRPAAFPGIRLAQLAALLFQGRHLLADIREMSTVGEAMRLFRVEAGGFWTDHYQPGVAAAPRRKQLGEPMVYNLIINTVAPVLFAWGQFHREQRFKDKALQWLAELPAEKNSITRNWQSLDIACRQAWDSQS
ncbi:MAG: DUF2851 family protein, partial [Bacteroidetes bacterium]|nr:DUF2851 family protein [Bacteroidota bacterium]